MVMSLFTTIETQTNTVGNKSTILVGQILWAHLVCYEILRTNNVLKYCLLDIRNAVHVDFAYFAVGVQNVTTTSISIQNLRNL